MVARINLQQRAANVLSIFSSWLRFLKGIRGFLRMLCSVCKGVKKSLFFSDWALQGTAHLTFISSPSLSSKTLFKMNEITFRDGLLQCLLARCIYSHSNSTLCALIWSFYRLSLRNYWVHSLRFITVDCVVYQQKYKQSDLPYKGLSNTPHSSDYALFAMFFILHPLFSVCIHGNMLGFYRKLMHFTVPWFKFCSLCGWKTKCPSNRDFDPFVRQNPLWGFFCNQFNIQLEYNQRVILATN